MFTLSSSWQNRKRTKLIKLPFYIPKGHLHESTFYMNAQDDTLRCKDSKIPLCFLFLNLKWFNQVLQCFHYPVFKKGSTCTLKSLATWKAYSRAAWNIPHIISHCTVSFFSKTIGSPASFQYRINAKQNLTSFVYVYKSGMPVLWFTKKWTKKIENLKSYGNLSGSWWEFLKAAPTGLCRAKS